MKTITSIHPSMILKVRNPAARRRSQESLNAE